MAPIGHAYRLVAWNHAWKVVKPLVKPRLVPSQRQSRIFYPRETRVLYQLQTVYAISSQNAQKM